MPTSHFTPPPRWIPSKPAIVVAGGSSIVPRQLKLLEDVPNIITVNNMFRYLPDDVLICYAGDYQWWAEYHSLVTGCTLAALWTGDYSAAEKFQLNYTQCLLDRFGIGRTHLVHGGNSGYQAMNLAYLLGATHIILLGFDCMYGPAGQRHYYPDHPKHFNANADQIKSWATHFGYASKFFKGEGVRVVNCSTFTALTCFERGHLEDWINI